MVLTPHLLIGAAIASRINLPLGLVLAFLSHYLLDFLPHWEYSIKNIQQKLWKKSLPEFLKIFLDISIGAFLIFIISKNLVLAGTGGFLAILPDGLILLILIFPNKLFTLHNTFMRKIHFLKDKKISPFWGIFSQSLVIAVAIYFLSH